MLALSLAFAVSAAAPSVDLSRGGTGDADFRYWAVADTFLDNAKPAENFGRDPLLSGGPGKTVLLKFGDLRRLVGEGRQVRRARLILTQEIGDVPQIAGVYKMNAAWGEGPGRRGVALLATPVEPGGKSPNASASWESPTGGLRHVRWQADGARGLADRESIREVSGVRSEQLYIVDGLGPAVQRMMTNPSSNHGFALEFRNVVDFRSSEARTGRPVLQIETEEAPIVKGGDVELRYVSCNVDLNETRPKAGDPVTWTAHFAYSGPGSSGPMRAAWLVDGKETLVDLPQGLADGQVGTTSFEIPWRSLSNDHRSRPILVKIETGGSDVRSENNALQFFEGAQPVSLAMGNALEFADWNQAVNFLNETALPMSRFSFAMDGVRTGIRVQGVSTGASTSALTLRDRAKSVMLAAGIPDLQRAQVNGDSSADRASSDPFPGLMGGGDTRNDEAYPAILGLPMEPFFDPATDAIGFESSDLLSATEVSILHAKMKSPLKDWREATPKVSVLRVLDSMGALVKGARLEFYRRADGKFPPVPTFTVENSEGGIVSLSAQGRNLFDDPSSGVLMVRVSRLGTSATGFIKAWQAIDSFGRGNIESGIVPLQVALPATKPADVNLARDRLVEDSRASALLKLADLTDGKTDVSLPWSANQAGWIEVDLQKDRALGKVRLSFQGGAIWDRFRIRVYSTGQKPDVARTWATETSGKWMLANRGASGTLDYFGPLTQARYIRLDIPAGTTSAQLSEVEVYGLE